MTVEGTTSASERDNTHALAWEVLTTEIVLCTRWSGGLGPMPRIRDGNLEEFER